MVAQLTTDITSNNPVDRPVPIEKIISLRLKGLTFPEIGKIIGRSKQAVWLRFKEVEEHIDALPEFKQYRADYFAFLQRRILSSLTTEDIKKCSAYQRVGMFSLLYDKERLERGETTQNIGYADYTKALTAVLEKRKKLEEELGIDPDVVTVSSDDDTDTP